MPMVDSLKKPLTSNTPQLLAVGRVIAYDPVRKTIDAVLPGDVIVRRVKLSSFFAGTTHGASGVAPALATNNAFSIGPVGTIDAYPGTGEHDVYAIIAYIPSPTNNFRRHTRPVCLGFIFPDTSQFNLNDPNLFIMRWNGDSYLLADGNGTIELHCPDGSFFKLGDASPPVDLAALAAQSSPTTVWTLTDSLGTPRQLRLHSSGGADLIVGPGNTVTITGDLEVAGSIHATGTIHGSNI